MVETARGGIPAEYTDTLQVTAYKGVNPVLGVAYTRLIVAAPPGDSYRLKDGSGTLADWLDAHPGWKILSYRPAPPGTGGDTEEGE